MWVHNTDLLNVILLVCSGLGLLYAIINAIILKTIKINPGASMSQSYNKFHDEDAVNGQRMASLLEVGEVIERVRFY